MPTALFESFDRTAGGWSLCLDRPQSVMVAQCIAEVPVLLERADAAAHAGFFVALMLSYEAAPAFDPALLTHAPNQFPLAWAAIFESLAPAPSPDTKGAYDVSEWVPATSKVEHAKAVHDIRQLIAAGETYQVNYTFQMAASFRGDARAWYQDLCAAQRAGYCAFLDLGQYQIISLSPELFFERRGDLIRTRPMKGTIRRGRWLTEDEDLSARLQASEKDRAENVMIVDLLRNDLGKIALPGSVHVSNLFELERYETLWQLTSTVSATARPDSSLLDLMTALFPCGSITGAPKIRTMEIINQLEPIARHVFTGAIGFLRPGGDCIFNVAIRTLILDDATGTVRFGVGGGITYGSTPQGEYDECLVKSNFLNQRPESFQLLETILLDEGKYFLLPEHLGRLQRSARFFDFDWDDQAMVLALQQNIDCYPAGRWRVRLLMDRDGKLAVQTTPISANENGPINVTLAATPVNSADRFLFHKTTRRSVYDNALRERPECDDVILWNERDEVTESTIANLIVTIAGQQWTPARSSGLLAGTFRNKLLEQGLIRERVIYKEELALAESLHLINSVRKRVQAVMVP
jgi:para-aminobenzoate synthetase/4-amino-4-deoxychorismate lyase